MGGQTGNRLAGESSPYLLQHADNPVDWYPWGEEAFERARQEDKPIFLSIGYSTCHWCHVMAQESFENPQIADILNRHFVSIKVDREERPDVDSIFMDFVQALTGSGGWPLSVFLTPEGKPFYGGTYFPPRDAYGSPGFARVLRTLHEAWIDRREELVHSAEEIAAKLQAISREVAGGPVAQEMLEDTYRSLSRRFDEAYGGFGFAPKFPQASTISFLLTYYCRTKDPRALHMAELTLTRMSDGGIHDHLGGGFHRYSVDREWLVPHFEKMLYDQALLARSYTQAYQVTARGLFADTVRDIIRFVLSEMRDAAGGFYSAIDADTQGHEGLYYLWDYDEILEILGIEEGQFFASAYGASREGNFEGKNILHRSREPGKLSEESGQSVSRAQAALRKGREELLHRRRMRSRPHRDEKIIAGWNGLMISALAGAGAVFRQAAWIDAAEQAACYILDTLLVNGRLRRYGINGQARGKAILEDYAFVIQGLLDLYEADFDPRHLGRAAELCRRMIELFEDRDNGGFYMTGEDAQTVLVRQKKSFDGATPSGNSTAAMVLMRMGALTGDAALLEKGQMVLKAFSESLRNNGAGLTEMMTAADFALGPRREIVVAGPRDDAVSRECVRVIHSRFMPRTVTLFHPGGSEGRAIEQIVPSIRSQAPGDSRPTVYLCENFVCQKPITDPHELCRKLEV